MSEAERAGGRRRRSGEGRQGEGRIRQAHEGACESEGPADGAGIVLTIGDVLFATGKADLSANANKSVATLAEF